MERARFKGGVLGVWKDTSAVGSWHDRFGSSLKEGDQIDKCVCSEVENYQACRACRNHSETRVPNLELAFSLSQII
jgi:hypothetical protein